MIYTFGNVPDYLDVLKNLAQNKGPAGPVIFVTDNVQDMVHTYYVPIELHRCRYCGHLEFRYLCEMFEADNSVEPCPICEGVQELAVGVDMVIRHTRVIYWRKT